LLSAAADGAFGWVDDRAAGARGAPMAPLVRLPDEPEAFATANGLELPSVARAEASGAILTGMSPLWRTPLSYLRSGAARP